MMCHINMGLSKNYVIAGVQLTSRAKMLSILDRSAPCFYLFLVLWLLRISLDCVMVKQLKRNSNWFTRKQSENAPSVMDFSSTTVKNTFSKRYWHKTGQEPLFSLLQGFTYTISKYQDPHSAPRMFFFFPDTEG